MLVRSEYVAGQFTNEDLSDPLAYLCVPGCGLDCDLSSALAEAKFDFTFTKISQSAFSSEPFCRWAKSCVKSGIKELWVCGFLFEHCVSRTAIDLRQRLPTTELSVIVCEDLSAARKEKYIGGSESVYESTKLLLQKNQVLLKSWV